MEEAGSGCGGGKQHSQGCCSGLACDDQTQGLQHAQYVPGLCHFTSSYLSFLHCKEGTPLPAQLHGGLNEVPQGWLCAHPLFSLVLTVTLGTGAVCP